MGEQSNESSTSLSDHLEIARSTYADMLNDDERNRAYDAAIRIAVATMVDSRDFNPLGCKNFRCCDIGTGSGLLSMMIVRAFKDLKYDRFEITSYEAFEPMARCAKRVVEKNKISEHITIVPCRSDEVKYLDKDRKYDLLVAELLDTELIGEGCLKTYRHAVEELCQPNCLFIPHKANIYIQPIASALLFERQIIDNYVLELFYSRLVQINVPDEVRNCSGNSSIDDIQASQLVDGRDFYKLTENPILIHEFTFNSLEGLKLNESKEIEVLINERITQPPVLAFWWDIIMCDDKIVGKNLFMPIDELDKRFKVLSCAPTWARSKEMLERDRTIQLLYGREVWREHWLQGIYYFKNLEEVRGLISLNQTVKTEQKITIIANHDTFSWWFDIRTKKSETNASEEDNKPSQCTCGAHRTLTRTQFSYLNDRIEMRRLFESYLGCFQLRFIEFPIKAHLLIGRDIDPLNPKRNWKFEFSDTGIDHLMARVNPLLDVCLHSNIPWKFLHEAFSKSFAYRKRKNRYISTRAPVKHHSIKCALVVFDNLNRIRTDVGTCEGFDLSPVDEMINESAKKADQQIDSHYLWEYPCKRLSDDYLIYSSQVDGFKSEIKQGTYWKNLKIPITYRAPRGWKKGLALVIWAEIELETGVDEIISTGPFRLLCSRPILYEKIKWNKHFQQMVYFMHDYPLVLEAGRYQDVHLDVGFSPSDLRPIIQRAVDYNKSVEVEVKVEVENED